MSKSSSSNGINFLEGLTLLFIGLKIAKLIDWGWVWVFAPLWLPLALVLVITLVCILLSPGELDN